MKLFMMLKAMLASFPTTQFIPYVGWFIDRLSGLHQRFERTFKKLDQFFQHLIDNHIISGRTQQDHEDIINVLLKLMKENTGFAAAKISHENIKAVLLGQHFEFLPFGSGQRVCPGITMATTIVELGLANLLYWFDRKLPDGMKEGDIKMEEEAAMSLTISKKIAFSLVPIKYSTIQQNIA
ncbi:hypothetical protein FEM48_Zijuj10G0049000 [Ziziphus jujuba var. spinosa]|uniref:Uncharacterized protein n=1 Tax=Ziziphus jujuba var. spinosa TaxID=714518 RepID=A0A978ULE8_ZIZJJ|nr:hypothetical protein FEM48_Zijuj10G0049000 [Ziziphus jujuba var. spinosa]